MKKIMTQKIIKNILQFGAYVCVNCPKKDNCPIKEHIKTCFKEACGSYPNCKTQKTWFNYITKK